MSVSNILIRHRVVCADDVSGQELGTVLLVLTHSVPAVRGAAHRHLTGASGQEGPPFVKGTVTVLRHLSRAPSLDRIISPLRGKHLVDYFIQVPFCVFKTGSEG